MRARSFLPVAAAVAAIPLLLLGSPAKAEYFNCVSYVQKVTGLPLRGDAWEWWWAAADQQMARTTLPRMGAVLVFARSQSLRYGHVALVRKVLGPREILVDHANWSPRNGRRGQVERSVAVIDVSPANDWSQVRVWYEPVQDIGQTIYRTYGFIAES